MEVEAIRAILIVAAIARRDLVVVVNEYRARDAPILDLCLGAGLGLAFTVILPMRFEVLREQEIGGQRMKVALFPSAPRRAKMARPTVPTISGRGFW